MNPGKNCREQFKDNLLSMLRNSLSDCTYLVYSRPSKRNILYLAPQVALQWYELGIKLLDEDKDCHLKIIRTNYGNDLRKCCVEMFWYWLDSHPKASWQQLITALRSPGVCLRNVADTLEREFIG